MLKYRRYDPSDVENPIIIADDLVPEYLKNEIDEETEKLIKEQQEIEEKVMGLKLRVHPSIASTEATTQEMKTLNFRKNDLLGEVAKKIMEEFGVEGVDLKNFRLRVFDNKIKAKLAPYDQFDQQLHKIQIYNLMDVTYEIKRDDETFEIYDPNILYLKVVKYVEDYKYDFSKLETLPT